jgi:ATP-dependent Clp protease protease subunit
MKTIRIDGPIGQEPGELSAKWFRSQLPPDGSPVEVKFHSEGGSMFEAFAIFDTVKAYRGRKTATVESMAFSAASLLLCAFDDVAISPNGYTMVHAPYFDGDDGPKSERELLASLREKMIGIYAEKTRKPIATISRMIDEETFLDAESSISLGIVNRVARASSAVMARMPSRIVARIKAALPVGNTATARWKSAVDALASRMPKAKAMAEVEKSHPGLRLKMLDEVNGR